MNPDESLVVYHLTHKLWRSGRVAEVLLDEAGPTGGQLSWAKKFWEGPPRPAVWNIGRQRGKSYTAILMAVLLAILKSKSIIRYCAKTKESAAGIIGPTIGQIIETMPPELRPKKHGEFEWIFPNGSRVVVFGTDAQSFERGRGPTTDLLLLDEYAFYQDLEGVEAALLPSLQTTGGRVLYLSSPPTSMAHPAAQRIRTAQNTDRYVTDTFWSNPRINHEEIISAEAARLGMTREQLLSSVQFRREYLAELLSDSGVFFHGEWFAGRVLDEAPGGVSWVRSWDTAATEDSGSNNPDWTVGVKVGIQTQPDKSRRVIIADVKRFRKGPGETEKQMALTAQLDGVEVPIILEQEPGSAGKMVVHQNKTRVFFGHTVHSMRKTGAKPTYWSQLATQAEVGNLYLVKGDWNSAFINELLSIPTGHDDQADAASQGFAWLAARGVNEKIKTEAVAPNIQSKMRAIGM
jgi:predicted phage terminase large subunit-like protein